jgi:hypothetical protein
MEVVAANRSNKDEPPELALEIVLRVELLNVKAFTLETRPRAVVGRLR